MSIMILLAGSHLPNEFNANESCTNIFVSRLFVGTVYSSYLLYIYICVCVDLSVVGRCCVQDNMAVICGSRAHLEHESIAKVMS